MPGSVSNLQAVKVAQVILSAGNDKLNATAKQLADIKQHTEKLQQKLVKLEGPASPTSKSVSDKPPVKRKKLD